MITDNILKSLRFSLRAVITGCLLLATLGGAPVVAAQVVDRVVASVNGEIITLSELDRELGHREQQLLHRVPEAEQARARAEIRRQILSGMIDNLLVEQQAVNRGILVDEREIDQALDSLLAENQITKEYLQRDLRRVGMTIADYRKTLRFHILQSRLLSLEVRERVIIPEKSIREYYEQNYAGLIDPKAYHLLQMGFVWSSPSAEAKEEARQRALRAREQVLAGGDFRKLARELSDLPSGSLGGDLGVLKKNKLSPEIQRYISALSPGDLTSVLETATFFQFFQLLSDQGVVRSPRAYEEVKEEIREKLYRQALEIQFEKWVENLRAGAYIKIIL